MERGSVVFKETDEVEVWADGCCEPNPGLGGWGELVVHRGLLAVEGNGGDPDTTNNRMELFAAMQGIAAAGKLGARRIKVCSDSKYVVLGASEWCKKWAEKDWMLRKARPAIPSKGKHQFEAARPGKPVANAGLWQRLF